jgi:hypothetical protein
MAVAHSSLISIWDSTSLSIVHHVIGPTSNDLVYLSFVEPASILGNVFLIFASHRSISVLDILTLNIVWTSHGKYSLFSTAKLGFPILTSVSPDIYFCCLNEKSDSNSSYEDNDSNEKNKTLGDHSPDATQYDILFFDFKSSSPVFKKTLLCRPISISIFCNHNQTENDKTYSIVFIVLNNNQSMILFDDTIQQTKNSFDNYEPTKVTRNLGSKLPHEVYRDQAGEVETREYNREKPFTSSETLTSIYQSFINRYATNNSTY